MEYCTEQICSSTPSTGISLLCITVIAWPYSLYSIFSLMSIYYLSNNNINYISHQGGSLLLTSMKNVSKKTLEEISLNLITWLCSYLWEVFSSFLRIHLLFLLDFTVDLNLTLGHQLVTLKRTAILDVSLKVCFQNKEENTPMEFLSNLKQCLRFLLGTALQGRLNPRFTLLVGGHLVGSIPPCAQGGMLCLLSISEN